MRDEKGRRVIDADVDYVAGPMRPGDEHPVNKGWFYTGRFNRKGDALWYKPPGPISRWIRRIALAIYLALMALGIFAAFVIER